MNLDPFRKISLALVILWACSFLVFHVASVLVHMLLVVAVLFYVGYLYGTGAPPDSARQFSEATRPQLIRLTGNTVEGAFRDPYRSFTRRTNFSPDHTSVTAHTLTSTNPASRPIPRTRFSSRSEATPELFFGQLTQNMPAGASSFVNRENSSANSARDLLKSMAKSSMSPGFVFILHPANASRNSARTSAGAFAKRTRKPGLMPNFFGSGVPEYPGILMAREKKNVLG
jgi:hypothetical protein